LCVEDWLFAIDWAERIGGLDGLIARADANAAALDRWVSSRAGSSIWRRIRRSVRTPRSACNSAIAPTRTPTARGRRRSRSC
jgi:phosphoserine aminotransferase